MDDGIFAKLTVINALLNIGLLNLMHFNDFPLCLLILTDL